MLIQLLVDASEDQGSGVEIEFDITEDSEEGLEDTSGDNEDEGEQTETEQGQAQQNPSVRQVTSQFHLERRPINAYTN